MKAGIDLGEGTKNRGRERERTRAQNARQFLWMRAASEEQQRLSRGGRHVKCESEVTCMNRVHGEASASGESSTREKERENEIVRLTCLGKRVAADVSLQ